MDTLEPGKNTGLIAPKIEPFDFVAGAETGIVYEVREEDGDWEKYKPTDEWQRRFVNGSKGYDTMSCVTFSALNSIESQIEYMLAKNLIPTSTVTTMRDLGYFDSNGRVNFSDWYTALDSGTTENGNSLQKVGDSIRTHGLIPAGMGYVPNDFTSGADWFDKIRFTEAMKDTAKKFLEMFSVKYEWAITSPNVAAQDQFTYHLKQSPVQVATPTCTGWNTKDGIVPNCGEYKRLNHATTVIGIKEDEYYKDLDHYTPFVKKLAWDYYVPVGFKYVVTLKTPVVPPPEISYHWSRTLTVGSVGEDVTALQKVLLIEVPGDFKATATGGFYSWTKKGVIALQEKYAQEILAPLGLTHGTGFVGAATLKWLNVHYGA